MLKSITKNLVISTFCISFLMLSGVTSQAQNGYCTGLKVLEAGGNNYSTGPVNAVRLYNTREDCGNFPVNTALWFKLEDGNRAAMLAAALTSLAIDGQVTIVPKISNKYTNWGTLIHLTASPKTP